MSAAAAGRRPGNVDTRGEIVEAAKRVFAAKGYDGASLRAVAREAEVDPALVHHYFDGKASLFVAAMALPFDPGVIPMHEHPDAMAARAGGVPGLSPGKMVITGFLTMWDQAEGTGSSFASCVAGMAASVNVADAMREFVSERIWEKSPVNEGESDDMTRQRRALVSSQLMGLAFIRYILRVPPISTTTPEEIARWAGPTLDRYMVGVIDGDPNGGTGP
ncbi:MAG TPA: TetR family transcriptional regulator [Acidimicrobiales bacterium]|jgi:AcrR family transcriptional regulator|nr:TetR family transcriptional regulator [Acidimicrobiales bacterium]